MIVSFVVTIEACSAHLVCGSKVITLNFEGRPFLGTTVPQTPSFKGSLDEDSLISQSHVDQLPTSIQMSQMRSGGAFTVMLCRKDLLVPSAMGCSASEMLACVFTIFSVLSEKISKVVLAKLKSF